MIHPKADSYAEMIYSSSGHSLLKLFNFVPIYLNPYMCLPYNLHLIDKLVFVLISFSFGPVYYSRLKYNINIYFPPKLSISTYHH